MFENILSRFQDRHVIVTIDPLMHPRIRSSFRSIGPVRLKFTDAAEFLERFMKNDGNELRILIDIEDDDDKQEISEHIGAGLSIILAEKLCGIPRSSIRRIKRSHRQTKPDFEGFLNNLRIIWESKGSINPFSQGTIDHARNQKNSEPASFAFASFATLNSDCVTSIKVDDPPTLPLNGDELKSNLAKVKHYIDLFNFIGQAELSKYFKFVGKRLTEDTKFPEFGEKVRLYDKIKRDYIRINIMDRVFLGNIERISKSEFLFTGFDERLLSVHSFIEFRDSEEDG